MDKSEYNYTVCLLVLQTTSQSPQLWGLLLHSHFCQMTSLLLEKHAEPSLGSRPDSISQTTTVSGNIVIVHFNPMGMKTKKDLLYGKNEKKKKFFIDFIQNFLGACVSPGDTSLLELCSSASPNVTLSCPSSLTWAQPLFPPPKLARLGYGSLLACVCPECSADLAIAPTSVEGNGRVQPLVVEVGRRRPHCFFCVQCQCQPWEIAAALTQ